MCGFCSPFIDAWVGLKNTTIALRDLEFCKMQLTCKSSCPTHSRYTNEETRSAPKAEYITIINSKINSYDKPTDHINPVPRPLRQARTSWYLFCLTHSKIYSICFIAVLSWLSTLQRSQIVLGLKPLETNEALCKWEFLWISIPPPKTAPLC